MVNELHICLLCAVLLQIYTDSSNNCVDLKKHEKGSQRGGEWLLKYYAEFLALSFSSGLRIKDLHELNKLAIDTRVLLELFGCEGSLSP